MTTSDPRVFFAAERTLLAWVRTGIAIIGLGFVVSKFGLFIRLLSRQESAPTSSPPVSGFLGVAFVLIGSAAILSALVQHRRFVATLPGADLPSGISSLFTAALVLLVALLGLSLGAYLLGT